MLTANEIMQQDSNPTKETLKVEFKQKLQGLPTHRQIRQAMQAATTVQELERLIEIADNTTSFKHITDWIED